MNDLGNLIVNYGYIGIFIILVLGIVGLPIPDEVLLTYVGYNIFIGRMSWIGAISAALAGALIGISISYLLGRKLGLPFLRRFGPKVHISDKKIDWTQSYFEKHGGLLLMFGYFLPGIRHITAYIAGIADFRFGKFAIFAYLGAVLWVNIFILLGILLGDNWTVMETILHDTTKIVVIGISVAALLFFYFKFRKKKTD